MSNHPTTPKLSVVIPVFNESGTIRTLLERVRAVPIVTEIIVVDDCSKDGTRELLQELQTTFHFKLIEHEGNKGKGAALHSGFRHVTGDLTVVQDADLEYDPSDYVKLIRPFLEGDADVVYGSRYLARLRSPFWHTLANKTLTFLSNLLNKLHLTDMETCYKMFRTDVINKLPLRCDRFGFEPEVTALLADLGVRIREVPISYQPRGYSEGKKIGPLDAVKTVVAILLYGILR